MFRFRRNAFDIPHCPSIYKRKSKPSFFPCTDLTLSFAQTSTSHHAPLLRRATRPPIEQRSTLVLCKAAPETIQEIAVERIHDVNKCYYPKKIDTDATAKPWYVVDAEGQILGRLASLVAVMIRGKLNPAYTPSMDMGAFIVVINAEKVIVSGKKFTDKVYYRHTVGRPGKVKLEAFNDLQKRIPEKIIEKAVKGMLPKGRLGRSLHTHLKIHKGPEHPHEAQKPLDITFMIDAKPKDYAKHINFESLQQE